MEQKNLKVAVFSQNTITNQNTVLNKWFSGKPKIPELTNTDPDIFVEMTQEDSRITTGPGLGSVIEHKAIKYEKKTIALNSMGGIDKNVIMQVYYNPELHIISIENGSIPLERKAGKGTSAVYATKGAVYVYIEIDGYKPLIFINMHLPINTKDTETFGYEHRKNSFLNVINEINTKYLNKNPTIIIGGDLNFRIVGGKDQLTELLREDNTIKFEELDFPEPSYKTFTCKFQEKASEKCREQPEPPLIDELTSNQEMLDKTIQKIKENVQEQCGDKDRFPSRCDRFLTNDSTNMKVIVHKSDYIPELPSDHNSIYALLEIKPINPTVPNGGKRNKKIRKTIKKRKMNKKRSSRRR